MSQKDVLQWEAPASGAAAPTQGTRLLSETTIFEKFIELPLRNNYKPRKMYEFMYLVTCNLRESDLAVAEAEYWGTFTDIVRRTAAGQLGFFSFDEFIARVLFELRVQTHGGRPDHTYDVLVRNGSEGGWKILQKTDDSFHDAVNSYYSAWKKDPERNDFLWVNVVFVKRPPSYYPPGPSDSVAGHFLHSLQHGPSYTSRSNNGPDKASGAVRHEHNRSQPGPSARPAPGASQLSQFIQAPLSTPDRPGLLGVPQNNRLLHHPLPPLPSSPITSDHSGGSNTKKLLSALPKIQSKLRNIKDRISPRSPIAKTPDILLQPAEEPTPVEPPTVLTALGSEIKQGGIHNLNGLLPVTASPSPEQWRRCCRLIPDLNPGQLALNVRARSICLPYSKLCITPVQFYSAYQMLQGGSGLLCHDMGLGKTHTVIATAALKAVVVYSKRRCDNDWASQFSSRHLPRDAAQAGLRCPTQDKRPGDVECFCVPDGTTRQIYDELARSPGASLIHIPSSARGTWLEAIVNAEFRTSSYNFRFISKSADVPADLRSNLEMTKNTLFRMGAAEKTKSVRTALDLEWTSRSGLDGLGSFIFIVLHSDPDWYNAFQYRPSDLRPRPQPDCVFTGPNGTCYAAPIGLTFIDEAHMPGLWRSTSSPMMMARCHHHIVGAQTWFVTGTPFGTQGPMVLETALQIIDANLAHGVPRLVELYEDAVHKRTRKYIEDFTIEFQRIFNHNIVLRFTHQTRFFGQQISGIQAVQPVIVSRRLPKLGFARGQIQHLVTKGQARLPTNLPYSDALDVSEATRQVRDELYFVSLFPNAAKLIDAGKIVVHERAMRDSIRALGDERGSVHRIPEVRQFWEEVVRDSPKARVIVQELDRMRKDRRARRLPQGAPARPGQPKLDATWKKMVIVTPTVASAVYLYMYLRLAPELSARDISPVLYHQDLSQRQRSALQEDLNSLDRNRPANRTAGTIVGPFDAIGTGINLQAASFQVLTSPPARADHLAQAFARTNREGQALPVEHRVLVLEDSPVDRINMAALAQRDVASDPYDLSRRLELRPAPGAPGGPARAPPRPHEDLYKLNQQLAQAGHAEGRSNADEQQAS